MKHKARVAFPMVVVFFLVTVLAAQVVRNPEVRLKNWPAPLYWQPTPAGTESSGVRPEIRTPIPEAATPAGSLVFVAMSPCRVVDTRSSSGFPSPFGMPGLSQFPAIRTFPIQLSTTCSVPSSAQAYSFNVTLIPNPLGSAVGYLTLYPTAAAPNTPPTAVTLDDYPTGDIRNNAAIVPAGIANGSVSAVTNGNLPDLIIDINGYYAPSTGVTLAQGTAAAPSLSFSGDAGTGIFSSAPGILDLDAGGTSRLKLDSLGNVSVMGNLNVIGTPNGVVFADNTKQTTAALRTVVASAFLPGAFNLPPYTAAKLVPDQGIAVTRVTLNLKTPSDSGCTPTVVRVWDGGTGEDLLLTAGQSAFDTGPQIIPFVANSNVQVALQRSALCFVGTPPADANVLVHYRLRTPADTITCPTGNAAFCGGICTNTSSDPLNCGGCGQPCPPPANALAGCQNSTCGIGTCQYGWADCDSMSNNGCETNLYNDPRNCGACGHVCSMGQTCSGLTCH